VYLPGTFQPTFLYECIWDLITVGLVLLIERKVKLRRGYLFAAYAAIYTFGRFFTEYLRIDPSHRYLGLRLNDWTSVFVFVCASALLLLKGRPKPGDDLVGEPLPAAVLAGEKAREDRAAHRAGHGEAAEASGAAPAEEATGLPSPDDGGPDGTEEDGTERAGDASAEGTTEPSEPEPSQSGKREPEEQAGGPQGTAPVRAAGDGTAPAPITPSSPADREGS
jgi:hypothetical protein